MSKKLFERAFVDDLKACERFEVQPMYNVGQATIDSISEKAKTDDELCQLITGLNPDDNMAGASNLMYRVAMSAYWKDNGKPVFNITPELAAALIMSELPNKIDTPPPFPAFLLSIQVKPGNPTPLVIDGRDYFGLSFIQMDGAWSVWVFPRYAGEDIHYEKIPPRIAFHDWAKRYPGSIHLHRFLANFIAYVSAKKEASDMPKMKKVKLGARKGLLVCSLGQSVKLHRNLLYAARGEAKGEGLKLQKRHIVRGHWRDQPYGKREEGKTRRKWLQPYWKGPDVIEATERVYDVS